MYLDFNSDCFTNDVPDFEWSRLVPELGVEEAGKVTVQPLVPADELVRECETGHETPAEGKNENVVRLGMRHTELVRKNSTEWQQSTHLFFNQKMDANDPEKKIPSTAAKAITLSPNVACHGGGTNSEAIHTTGEEACMQKHGRKSFLSLSLKQSTSMPSQLSS